MEPITLVQELGLPITIIIAGGYGIWAMIRWLQGTLLKHIEQVASTNQANEEETKVILIKLVDRIRQLQTDIVRLDCLIRIKWKIPVDERRIERKTKED